jgi:hypothetical protein
MDKSKIRLPDGDLSDKATAHLAELTARPHHPSAAAQNIAKTRDLLRARLAKKHTDIAR